MKTLNLCLHKGARFVEAAELATVETPEPTESWHPIPHTVLLDIVQQEIQRAGNCEVVQTQHGLSRNGGRYFGLMQVANGDADKDYATVIGLRNAHDKKCPAGLVIGSGVFVCDNMAFSGEAVFARRHTRRIMDDLPGIVNRALGTLTEVRGQMQQRLDHYRSVQLEESAVNDIVINALDARVISCQRIPKVLNEWRTPVFDEHKEYGQSAWLLMNAFTETFKSTNIMRLPKKSQALHGILDKYTGFTPSVN